MRKYWVVFKVALSERLVYRTDFFIATFLRFVPIITTILLWQAIYAGAGATDTKLAGLSYHEMVSYYLFVMVTRAFSSMPGLGSGIATAVREGELRKFLLQPIDYVTYLLSLRVAHKSVYYVMAFVPYFIVFWMCRAYLPGWPGIPVLGLYLISLVLAFLLGFATSCAIGLLSFWFLEVSTFLYLFMIASYFLSGHMFPLNLLPNGIQQVVTVLPFAYETYYPTMIILRKLPPDEVLGVIATQVFWVVVMFGLTRLAWSRGLRRYAAFGG